MRKLSIFDAVNEWADDNGQVACSSMTDLIGRLGNRNPSEAELAGETLHVAGSEFAPGEMVLNIYGEETKHCYGEFRVEQNTRSVHIWEMLLVHALNGNIPSSDYVMNVHSALETEIPSNEEDKAMIDSLKAMISRHVESHIKNPNDTSTFQMIAKTTPFQEGPEGRIAEQWHFARLLAKLYVAGTPDRDLYEPINVATRISRLDSKDADSLSYRIEITPRYGASNWGIGKIAYVRSNFKNEPEKIEKMLQGMADYMAEMLEVVLNRDLTRLTTESSKIWTCSCECGHEDSDLFAMFDHEVNSHPELFE